MSYTLLVTLDYPPNLGGIARYYGARVKAMRERGEGIVVLAPTLAVSLRGTSEASDAAISGKRWGLLRFARNDTSDDTDGVIRLNFFSRFLWPRWLPLLFSIWKEVRRVRPSIIWVGEVLPTGTAVYLLSRLGLLTMPYAVFVHGMDIRTPVPGSRKHRLMCAVLKHADHVMANSAFVKEEVVRLGVPADRVRVEYPITATLPPVDPKTIETLRTRHGLRGKFILLTVARLVRRKGIDFVLAALRQLNNPNIVYVVVGDGAERAALELQSADLPTLFTGSVSDTDLAAWYTLCDAFIMTPRESTNDVEGFGIVYHEAAAYGKPIIASRSGGIPEAVKGIANVTLVPPEDVSAIVEAIDRYYRGRSSVI